MRISDLYLAERCLLPADRMQDAICSCHEGPNGFSADIAPVATSGVHCGLKSPGTESLCAHLGDLCVEVDGAARPINSACRLAPEIDWRVLAMGSRVSRQLDAVARLVLPTQVAK